MKPLNATMLRWVVQANGLGDDASMCFRPKKAGSRPMYSPVVADWVATEYQKDPELFQKARLAVIGARAV